MKYASGTGFSARKIGRGVIDSRRCRRTRASNSPVRAACRSNGGSTAGFCCDIG
jgi:hypothetical protein